MKKIVLKEMIYILLAWLFWLLLFVLLQRLNHIDLQLWWVEKEVKQMHEQVTNIQTQLDEWFYIDNN
jgi:uncharacterized protein YoxC